MSRCNKSPACGHSYRCGGGVGTRKRPTPTRRKITETVERGRPTRRAICHAGKPAWRSRMIALIVRTGVAAG